MSEFLTVDALHRNFKIGGTRIEVLRGVSLSLEPGEILGIVGPSGAGKSTLLHLMGFLDRPTAGDVVFRGRSLTGSGEWTQNRTRNRSFGFVFQLHQLLPELTALENAMMPLMIRTGVLPWFVEGARHRRRTIDLLDRVRIGHRLHHRPGELSVGERQRVAIARALACDPEIVFCDEPTGSLDSDTGREIQSLIRGLREELKKTFVIVTHDPTIARMADRCIRMVDGRIVD